MWYSWFQTSQTGQEYSDTSPFSITWPQSQEEEEEEEEEEQKEEEQREEEQREGEQKEEEQREKEQREGEQREEEQRVQEQEGVLPFPQTLDIEYFMCLPTVRAF